MKDYEELKGKIKEIREAGDALEDLQNKTKSYIKILRGFCWISLSCMGYFIYTQTYLFLAGCLFLTMIWFAIAMKIAKDEMEKREEHIDQSRMLESWWKGEIIENGDEWRMTKDGEL
jgi:hypothetical protein